jgi:hypothetical protein
VLSSSYHKEINLERCANDDEYTRLRDMFGVVLDGPYMINSKISTLYSIIILYSFVQHLVETGTPLLNKYYCTN